MLRSPAIETTYEGTVGEILDQIKNLPTERRVRLQLLPEVEGNLFEASAEEQAEALDRIAAMNKGRPVLSAEDLRRENLYEERL